MNTRILFLIIMMALGFTTTALKAKKVVTPLVSKPVVFIDLNAITTANKLGEPPLSHEYADIMVRENKLLLSPDPDKITALNLLEVQRYKLMKKLIKVSKSIAKRLGAYSVVPKSYACIFSPFWVDPAYDITKEVIDTLNKEYDATHCKC